jgi:4,5-DOPA dioxygenase extradiol
MTDPASSSPSSSSSATTNTPTTSALFPVLFLGHGSPMNAIEDNDWSRAFRELGTKLPRPRAVLVISAHWYTHGSWLTGDAHPRTLHDFGGFPDELFAQQYVAPGDPKLARHIAQVLGRSASMLRTDWGLDHGTWTVLKFLFPKADVPVIQLSIDGDLSGAAHVDLGKRLAALRADGVLVVGSGNITHNLRDAFARMRSKTKERVLWAERFDADIAAALTQRDLAFLARAHESTAGTMAHPTPDHYLPLLYGAGAALSSDAVAFPIEGFDAGSLSMRAVRWG